MRAKCSHFLHHFSFSFVGCDIGSASNFAISQTRQSLPPIRTNIMNIDIIGAGIGGLTTAIALEQKGINTRIFEQAEQIKPIGAGIILANNAMQVYEKLGLRKEIEENGNPISSMNITKSNLNPLSRIDLTYFEQKYKTKNIAIHRPHIFFRSLAPACV